MILSILELLDAISKSISQYYNLDGSTVQLIFFILSLIIVLCVILTEVNPEILEKAEKIKQQAQEKSEQLREQRKRFKIDREIEENKNKPPINPQEYKEFMVIMIALAAFLILGYFLT